MGNNLGYDELTAFEEMYVLTLKLVEFFFVSS